MRTPELGQADRTEERRLAAVRRYDVLDFPPDGAFDRVVRIAARVCDVPIATVSIVDEDRIWLRATHGLAGIDQLPREPGLCASAILDDQPHVVLDAATDPRTLDNSLVRGELGLRYYVGVPLVTAEGHRLGTLNVIDVAPREPTRDQLDVLTELAGVVVDELELRLSARGAVRVEANQAAASFRDSVVAGISHELRTPLAVLKGIATLTDQDPRALEDAAVRDTMRRQVHHLDWLVAQFLDFAHLEDARALDLDTAAFDLPAVAREAVDVLADHAPVRITGAPSRPAAGDRARTLQVLLELLNNAVRFGPTGAPIEVRLADGEDGMVTVAVTDAGPQLDAEDRRRVFDKHVHAPGSTGSGLGLYVARALARAQDGRLEVATAPGGGNRFTLTLPAASAS